MIFSNVAYSHALMKTDEARHFQFKRAVLCRFYTIDQCPDLNVEWRINTQATDWPNELCYK